MIDSFDQRGSSREGEGGGDGACVYRPFGCPARIENTQAAQERHLHENAHEHLVLVTKALARERSNKQFQMEARKYAVERCERADRENIRRMTHLQTLQMFEQMVYGNVDDLKLCKRLPEAPKKNYLPEVELRSFTKQLDDILNEHDTIRNEIKRVKKQLSILSSISKKKQASTLLSDRKKAFEKSRFTQAPLGLRQEDLTKQMARIRNLNNSLIACSKKGDLQGVISSLEEGANVEYRDSDGDTALIKAALFGHIRVVSYLVERGGAEVNATGNNHQTALIWAAWNGKLQVVRYLVLKAHANPKIQGYKKRTALEWAEKWRRKDVVEFLKAHFKSQALHADYPSQNAYPDPGPAFLLSKAQLEQDLEQDVEQDVEQDLDQEPMLSNDEGEVHILGDKPEILDKNPGTGQMNPGTFSKNPGMVSSEVSVREEESKTKSPGPSRSRRRSSLWEAVQVAAFGGIHTGSMVVKHWLKSRLKKM
ncbi:hypothetical protein AAMO2058_000286200 [Amorphochlora amoebiformis]